MSIAETLSSSNSPLRKRIVWAALKEIEFRLAVREDAPALARLFEQFFGEAGYKDRGVRYSRLKAAEWLDSVISRGRVPHLVAEKAKRLVGVASYDLDGTFCVEPVAVLHAIYVIPEERMSAIGRVLVALACDLAKQDGACAFHAPLASGMAEQRSLANLFRHEGFEEIGVTMGRRL